MNQLMTAYQSSKCFCLTRLLKTTVDKNLLHLLHNEEVPGIRRAIDQERPVRIAAGSQLPPRKRTEDNDRGVVRFEFLDGAQILELSPRPFTSTGNCRPFRRASDT